ncbi:unnamed protein product [Macrosiphum euphorbiae]|uniref:Uncharacterized protein n=1 Tax=Macrosiphum euphorbiae TaxID=13131 RepID=A0AAV0WQM1_9HEMI|nr:unnamed protein product [Macrosiphum euphorbiae]
MDTTSQHLARMCQGSSATGAPTAASTRPQPAQKRQKTQEEEDAFSTLESYTHEIEYVLGQVMECLNLNLSEVKATSSTARDSATVQSLESRDTKARDLLLKILNQKGKLKRLPEDPRVPNTGLRHLDQHH